MDNPNPAQNMELPKNPEGLTAEQARELVRAALAGEIIEDKTHTLSQEAQYESPPAEAIEANDPRLEEARQRVQDAYDLAA